MPIKKDGPDRKGRPLGFIPTWLVVVIFFSLSLMTGIGLQQIFKGKTQEIIGIDEQQLQHVSPVDQRKTQGAGINFN